MTITAIILRVTFLRIDLSKYNLVVFRCVFRYTLAHDPYGSGLLGTLTDQNRKVRYYVRHPGGDHSTDLEQTDAPHPRIRTITQSYRLFDNRIHIPGILLAAGFRESLYTRF